MKKALEVTKSDKPPLQEDGRKKGYMQEEMGYENLALANQNLRDQAARLRKTLGNVAETISRRVENKRESDKRKEFGNRRVDNTKLKFTRSGPKFTY